MSLVTGDTSVRDSGDGTAVNVGDSVNKAVRVNVVSGNLPNYDYAKLAQTALTDVWTFKTGGSGGTLVATMTITYTDATKATIDNVAKT